MKLPKIALSAAMVAAAAAILVFGIWVGAASEGRGPEAAVATSEEGAEQTIWTCSMHPQIRMNEPGKCPICGMDLIPVAKPKADEGASDTRVVLSERAKLLARVRTTKVERGSAAVEMRLLGRLDQDETRMRTVTSWVGGRIDRLFVRVTGAQIGGGQVVARLYSPEIYSAQQDLILAKKQVATLDGAVPIAQKAAGAALESARQRLRLLGVPDDELAIMEDAEAPTRSVAIRSPYGGTVTERLVSEGAYVTAGAPLFRVVDLSRLWAQLDAYESDLSRVSVGQSVVFEVASFPGERFEGRVAFVNPVVNPRTRTAEIRVEIPNKDGRLRPGMFGEAVLAAPIDEDAEPTLVIPKTAPLFTGRRSIVYVEVALDPPTYEAREVWLGPRAGDVYPVVRGLEEGERIVIEGAFALDSDLQIHAGRSMMTMSDDRAPALAPAPAPVDHAAHAGHEGRAP